MANKRLSDIRLTVADNGYILNWTEFKPKSIKDSDVKISSEGDWDYKSEVYGFENGHDALKRMSDLLGIKKED